MHILQLVKLPIEFQFNHAGLGMHRQMALYKQALPGGSYDYANLEFKLKEQAT